MFNKRISAVAVLLPVAVALCAHVFPPLWFLDDQIRAQTPSRDAGVSADVSLKSIAVSPKEIVRFDAGASGLAVGFSHEVGRVSVVAMPTHPRATVEYRSATDLDTSAPGLQFEPVAGEVTNIFISVVAENGLTKATYALYIGRGTSDPFGWKASDDFDNLFRIGYQKTRGIWSDGTTLWAVNWRFNTIYAYNLSDKLGLELLSIPLASENAYALDIWSDGATMWVADFEDPKIYAYGLANKRRIPELDIELEDGHSASGIWSNGETMWVSDTKKSKIYSYRMSDRQYEPGAEVNTVPGNELPAALWSNGTTMWVADALSTQIFAYRLFDWSRLPEFDFRMIAEQRVFDRHVAAGLWSDGQTMWISSGRYEKIFSHNMPMGQEPLQRDSTLERVVLSPTGIIEFQSDITDYTIGVGSEVDTATITPIARAVGATIEINDDPNIDPSEYEVELEPGKNVVTIKVIAADATTTSIYNFTINRGSTEPFGWKVTDDFDDLRGSGENIDRAIWSDGTTMWVTGTRGFKIDAYSMADKQRDPTSDILLTGETFLAKGFWSDGKTVWLGRFPDRILAYDISDGARIPESDIGLLGENELVTGLWSDGDTMWVSDFEKDKLFAYGIVDKQRRPELDFDLSPDNQLPGGMWSDGETMWVSEGDEKKLFAYRMVDQMRMPHLDFETIFRAKTGTVFTGGFDIWSDGNTMWVVDGSGEKIFSYNHPDLEAAAASDATLSNLKLETTDTTVLPGDLIYHALSVASDVERVSISPTLNNRNAKIESEAMEVENAASLLIELRPGLNRIQFVVTSPNGSSTKKYTVDVGRGSTDQYGWNAVNDFDALYNAGNHSPEDIWSNGETMWVYDRSRHIYAYDMSDMSRDVAKEFTIGERYHTFGGMWSDGETMWFPRWYGGTVEAYDIANKQRVTNKDLHLDPENSRPTDLWSDGSTLWVVDGTAAKIFAYKLSDMTRQPINDFILFQRSARSIWSDGETMWVLDGESQDVYRYQMSDKQPDIEGSPGPADRKVFRFPNSANGLWSDGVTMWIAARVHSSPTPGGIYSKIYNFNLQPVGPSIDDQPSAAPPTGGFRPSLTVLMCTVLVGALMAAFGMRYAARVFSPRQTANKWPSPPTKPAT